MWNCGISVVGLTRDNPDSQQVFLESDGFSALLRAMQAEDDRLQVKAVFMLRAMIMSNSKFKGKT